MLESAGLTPLAYGGRRRRQYNPPILKRGDGPDTSLEAYNKAKTDEERDAIRQKWIAEAERERRRDSMLIC